MTPHDRHGPVACLAATALGALVALAACAGSVTPVEPVRRDAALAARQLDRVRLVLVGDTGLPGVEMSALREAVRREAKDYVVALGDLFYPYPPSCPTGELDADARAAFDANVGATIGDLGAPTLLVLGNHDTRHRSRAPAREACFLTYAADRPDLLMPELWYTLDVGVALLAFTNTNALTPERGEELAARLRAHDGWRLVFGHHGLRVTHDKECEDAVRRWMLAHDVYPDLYANGHAHLLQFGVYDGVAAVTSGCTAKIRDRPTCPPDCGGGQLWGVSSRGYAVLEVSPERLAVTFKDVTGRPLYTWHSGARAEHRAGQTRAPRRLPEP